MPASRQISISLPDDVADAVRARVIAGDYVDDSDVVLEGLRALEEREQAVEDWLRGPVVEEYRALKAGMLSTIALDDLRREFAADSGSSNQ
jgi:putative addiction module CopG family antidote